jgi:hypothetical protein
MRLVHAIILAAFGLGAAGAANAQTRDEMERCRAIESEMRRLACYDAIRLSPGPPRSKYEMVPLEDLQRFALSYRGDLVEVFGWLTPGDDFFYLGADESDERTVPIDVQNVPRRDREEFLQECGEGCAAAVQGRVRPVNFTTGIVADAIFAR